METSLVIAVVICYISLPFAQSACGGGWSYDGKNGVGPDKWYTKYPKCGHRNQSPIDIDPKKASYDCKLAEVEIDHYFRETHNYSMVLKNNGHSVVVELTGDFALHGGGLRYDYKAAQFHFHWGSDNSKGSEHTIGGKSYPMEVHFVHANSKFSDISAAADKPFGLAVLGFFYEISDKPNPNYQWILNYTDHIKTCGKSFDLPEFRLSDLLPNDYEHYYRYEGSLTTPPCHESVTWTVFTETIKISQQQMDAFRSLKISDENATNPVAMVDNYRPVQQIYTRIVKTSVEPSTVSSADRTSPEVLITLILSSVIMLRLQY